MAIDLQQSFLERFPKNFLEEFSRRQFPIYKHAIAISHPDEWDTPEVASVLPIIRRAMMEKAFRSAAVAAGLKPHNTPHAGDNCSCVMVKSGAMIITEHFVEGPGQFVRAAKSRDQNRGVNQWVMEHIDPRLLRESPPTLGNHPTYFYLLHGAHFQTSSSGITEVDESSCFLRIAIPDSEADEYLFNWSVQELLQAYSAMKIESTGPHIIEDKAVPRTKVKIKAAKNAVGKTE